MFKKNVKFFGDVHIPTTSFHNYVYKYDFNCADVVA